LRTSVFVTASDRQIATELELSVRTVQNHLAPAYRKLGITRRHDLPEVLASAKAGRSIPGDERRLNRV
jgi:ATP/maltotriose-dependent transcriptional regulator MalT